MAYLRRYLTFRFGFGLALALSKPEAPAEEPTAITAHFTVFSATPISGLNYAPDYRADAIAVVFYPTARSPRYRYHGANPLQFYQDSAADSPDQPNALAAEVVLPPEIHAALILFFPIEEKSSFRPGVRYRCEVIDDTADRQKSGCLTIGNFSRLALSGSVEGQSVSLREGLNPLLEMGRSARITLATPFKGSSYRSYMDEIELAPGERALLLLFPPFRPGSLEVQTRLLIDKPPAERISQ